MKREAGVNPARSRHCKEDGPQITSLVVKLPGRLEGADESESGDLPVLKSPVKPTVDREVMETIWHVCLPVGSIMIISPSVVRREFFIAESRDFEIYPNKPVQVSSLRRKNSLNTKLSVVSFPRIGAHRELKNLMEGYWLGRVSKEKLTTESCQLRETHWRIQKEACIDYISSNDFSFYDNMLDMACLLNVIPSRYRFLGEDELKCYFAMARGVQSRKGDVTALDMKKWFNTNYHYIVPEIESGLDLKLNGIKPFAEYREAQACGINTKPVIIGPYTFIKLSKNKSQLSLAQLLDRFIPIYQEIISRFAAMGLHTLQIDEPAIVMAMNAEEQTAFYHAYKRLLPVRGGTRILLQTYFGDIGDIYTRVMSLDFDAIGLDLVEGSRNLDLIEKYGFPNDKQLFAGLVNGKNVWINNYARIMDKIKHLLKYVNKKQVVLGTSCSLLHVPFSIEYEINLGDEYRPYLSFAREKLNELRDLGELLEDNDYQYNKKFIANQALAKKLSNHPAKHRQKVRSRIKGFTEADYVHHPSYEERIEAQKKKWGCQSSPPILLVLFRKPQKSDSCASNS